MATVIKQGYASWEDLVGREVRFLWYDGWDDYYARFVLAGTRVYAEDFRYPRYYVLDENEGGYSFWEDEVVEVTVL